MPDINKPINMSEKDLIKRQEEIAPVNISESLVEMVRSSAPKADWKLTDEIVENICHNLGHGVPLEACAACVCVTPVTLKNWLKKGQDEICNLSQEEVDGAENILDILSPYGKLFLRQAQAKGQLMATIMDAIYDRMFEQHNEWLLTYLAERLDPETFNLKYKTEMKKIDNTNVNTGTQNFVNITFVNGMDGRPADEIEYLQNSLAHLKEKYANKHGQVIDAESQSE